MYSSCRDGVPVLAGAPVEFRDTTRSIAVRVDGPTGEPRFVQEGGPTRA